MTCDLCENHYECASGCCGSLEEFGVKRCREKCYDEFDNKLFADAATSTGYTLSCLIDADLVGAVAAGAAGLAFLIICCEILGFCILFSPILIGLICICKTCNDRGPLDKKMHEAEQAAKQKVENAKNTAASPAQGMAQQPPAGQPYAYQPVQGVAMDNVPQQK